MPDFVEDAGRPLVAGPLARWFALTGQTRGERQVGGRRVVWTLDPGRAFVVTHDPIGGVAVLLFGARPPVTYPVPVVASRTPSGGQRWWWGCPGCGRRVGRLYLPAGRPRLACRLCSELQYASKYRRRVGPVG